MAQKRLRTSDELESLPDQAVIYDDEFRVWQHGVAGMAGSAVCQQLGTVDWNTRSLWVTVGSDRVWRTADVALPALLLDDGL